jgi:hypothetical protein
MWPVLFVIAFTGAGAFGVTGPRWGAIACVALLAVSVVGMWRQDRPYVPPTLRRNRAPSDQ